MLILSIDDNVNNVSLDSLNSMADWHHHYQFFHLNPGVEHYKLLSYLSFQFPPGTTVYDIGTFLGYSALTLSHNPNVKVITYNIEENIPPNVHSIKYKNNIECKIKNCLEDIDELVKSPFIMLDTAHTGDFERQLIEQLIANNYKGCVLCDDIYLNSEMRQFWDWVPLKKIDVTKYGHWSGTGIIVFDESFVSIKVIE